MTQKYNKSFVIDYANHVQSTQGDAEELFDSFLDKYQKPGESIPDNIYQEVTNAAIEMCGVTIDELKSGRKYGDIPSCKQMISLVLFELKCAPDIISENLPFLSNENSIRSKLIAARRWETVDKSFRIVLNQLRDKFNVK